MKISVRANTFETNSSSVHAMVIDTREGLLEPNKQLGSYFNEEIDIKEYGRTYMQIFSDMESRLSYLWTGINEMHNTFADDKSQNYSEWYKSAYDNYHPYAVDLDIWLDKIKSVCANNEHIVFGTWNKREYFAGIDHALELMDFLVAVYNDTDLLRDFLLGKKSYVIIGSDELGFYDDVLLLETGKYFKEIEDTTNQYYHDLFMAMDNADDDLQDDEINLARDKVYDYQTQVHSFEDGKLKIYIKNS